MMECGRRRPTSPIPLLLFVAAFQACLSDFTTPRWNNRTEDADLTWIWNTTQDANLDRVWNAAVGLARRGSIAFPLSGNVYPLGSYTVSLLIGQPPKRYDLDIDTGSDLTWLQCDAPCTGCTKPRDQLYKPHKLVQCKDPLCSTAQTPAFAPCKTPNEQCDYEVRYMDHGSSMGVLVSDRFTFHLIKSNRISPLLAFGCGYNQHYPGPPPSAAGILGLGNGNVSFITQLFGLSVIRNALGHCLGAKGGFLFFGDGPLHSMKIQWVPMLPDLKDHYSAGPAELLNSMGKPTNVKGLQLIFDTGSSYTYFNTKAYPAVLNQLREDLRGKPLSDAKEDDTLPVCWKGPKPFQSVDDVKGLFKPLVLSFADNVQYQMRPEAYLVVTKHGNACLGILNGTVAGLKDVNVIGDISMLGKMVVYDNEKRRIGWVPANCDRKAPNYSWTKDSSRK